MKAYATDQGWLYKLLGSDTLKYDQGFVSGCLCLLDKEEKNLDEIQLTAIEIIAVQVITQRKHSELSTETARVEELINIFNLSLEIYKNLPIIALTASTLHNEERKFKESGMNGHILKPFNPSEIKHLLAKTLKK